MEKIDYRIIKHQGIDYVNVAHVYDNIIEYDDEILGRIVEEVGHEMKDRLYNPYFINERDKPEFEIYRFKKEVKCNA